MTTFTDFFAEVAAEIVEMRTMNFDRENNTDDAYDTEEFEQDVEDYLTDNYEADCKNAEKLRTGKNKFGASYMGNLWSKVCDDLEDYYKKKTDKHECEWGGCEKEAVYCEQFGTDYCSEHICESQGGDWCTHEKCESCNESRRLDAIEAAEMEKIYGKYVPSC